MYSIDMINLPSIIKFQDFPQKHLSPGIFLHSKESDKPNPGRDVILDDNYFVAGSGAVG